MSAVATSLCSNASMMIDTMSGLVAMVGEAVSDWFFCTLLSATVRPLRRPRRLSLMRFMALSVAFFCALVSLDGSNGFVDVEVLKLCKFRE